MPTIKRKVEMNLPQLIEWGWDNPEQIKGKDFKSNVKDVFGSYSIVQFSVDSFGFKTDGIRRKDTFTVEVEEEIAEDTKFKHLIEIAENDSSLVWQHSNIKQRIGNQSREFHAYIDGEFKCIWKKGKLVE
ncbi:hypothetical protein [Mammaliicoccus vitulinus]|uniref:hypothetical protein n=1 Tax=Mammaliicoccus vitulinus TaxID=71237 RepID=UPI0028D1B1F0|nr:hypothetical protein [Mammaliicoccus vitulinus]